MTDSTRLRKLADMHEEKAEVAEALDGEVANAYHLTRAEELRIEADRIDARGVLGTPKAAMAQLSETIKVSVRDVPEVRAALAVTNQLAEALRDVLAAVRGSNRLPDTTMKAEAALDAVRTASKKASAALAAYDAARGVARATDEGEQS